jgi:site-specific recombinase XerD
VGLLTRINLLRKQQKPDIDYLVLFLQSREAIGVSPKTLKYYRERLSKFIQAVDFLRASRQDIQRYLISIPPNQYGLGTRHASFRAMKVLYGWLNSEYDIPNPMEGMPAPILGKPILPYLDREQVLYLIEKAPSTRDKAAVALFVESGLRLSEHANIMPEHINWRNRTIRVLGKGRKEAYAAFGDLTEKYLKAWLQQYQPNGGNIWGLSEWGIASMLRRLEKDTGLTCNAHTLRRTFACLLRKAGVDTMTIKDLGRWESLEMVQRYTRSVTFDDSLRFYPSSLLNEKKL